MVDPDKGDKPVVIKSDDTRGALSADKTSRGDTLLPMLIGGLALCIVGIIVVFVFR